MIGLHPGGCRREGPVWRSVRGADQNIGVADHPRTSSCTFRAPCDREAELGMAATIRSGVITVSGSGLELIVWFASGVWP